MSKSSKTQATGSEQEFAEPSPGHRTFHDGFWLQIDATLQFEGGYVNDPNDAGGETNFGISRRSYPDLDIANLTRDEAIAIYRRDFWDAPGFGQLKDTIGAKVFDLAVNMGQRQAVRLLQNAANTVTRGPQIIADGLFGPLTIQAANTVSERDLLAALRTQAEGFYQRIVRNRPSQGRFLKGWLRRARA